MKMKIRKENNKKLSPLLTILTSVLENLVKFAKIGFFAFFIFVVSYVKEKAIWKIVYKSKTRR